MAEAEEGMGFDCSCLKVRVIFMVKVRDCGSDLGKDKVSRWRAKVKVRV